MFSRAGVTASSPLAEVQPSWLHAQLLRTASGGKRPLGRTKSGEAPAPGMQRWLSMRIGEFVDSISLEELLEDFYASDESASETALMAQSAGGAMRNNNNMRHCWTFKELQVWLEL